jgi:hypothetical protein
MSFESYTDCLFRAFYLHQKQSDIVKRKKEILDEVARFHNFSPTSILFVGFSPAILASTAKNIFVTNISSESRNLLDSQNIKYTHIMDDKISTYYKNFDVVVALDEYFTYAGSDNEQKDMVTEICNLAKEYVITTCKDYKNQEFKDREFSVPALIRGTKNNNIYLECHDYDLQDRNNWASIIYEIKNDILNKVGPFSRRTMYFKQLAKFSHDAGAVGFSVHKNLMYKSLIKKNYEHVISIRFDNNGP